MLANFCSLIQLIKEYIISITLKNTTFLICKKYRSSIIVKFLKKKNKKECFLINLFLLLLISFMYLHRTSVKYFLLLSLSIISFSSFQTFIYSLDRSSSSKILSFIFHISQYSLQLNLIFNFLHMQHAKSCSVSL